MRVKEATAVEIESMQRLTKQEIDRRIGHLAAELAAEIDDEEGDEEDEYEPLHPRWISAAELVRRLRPFVVYN